jgi:hypothetical protein
MPLTGKPGPTSLQVGSEACFIYNNSPQKAKIFSTSSVVTNPNANSSGVTETVYYLEGSSKTYNAEDLFDSYQSLLIHLSNLMGVLIEFPPQAEV